MSETPNVGLRERIEKASTKAEVKKLLAEGTTYEFAAQATRNAWKNTSRRVLSEMGEKHDEEPATVVADVTTEVFQSDKKLKKARKK